MKPKNKARVDKSKMRLKPFPSKPATRVYRPRTPSPPVWGRLRHVQCTSAAQRAVKKLDRVPLLMSSVQAAKQSNFDTETPLPTVGPPRLSCNPV